MSKGREVARKVVDATVNGVLRAAEAPRRARDQYERDMYTHGESQRSWRRNNR